MPELIIIYKKYTTTFPRLTEEEFNLLKQIVSLDPDYEILYTKTKTDILNAFINEFKFQIGWVLLLGIIIGLFDLNEFPLIIFVPLILWLILGGLVSITNFFEDIRTANRYSISLNKRFQYFDNYEEYLYFHKFFK